MPDLQLAMLIPGHRDSAQKFWLRKRNGSRSGGEGHKAGDHLGRWGCRRGRADEVVGGTESLEPGGSFIQLIRNQR